MAFDKVIDSAQLDADLTSIADAIREYPKNTGRLPFPDSFSSAIRKIVSDLIGMIDATATEIIIPNGVTSIRGSAFMHMSNITTVTIPDTVASIGSSAFFACTKLKSVKLPSATKVIGSQMFFINYELSMVDSYVQNIKDSQVFWGCSKLNLILRDTETVCTLGNTNSFDESAIAKGTGYIYVPSALVDSYKAATNWSTFAAQICAIEDYPDITGG